MEDAPPGQYFDDQLAAMVAARTDGLIGGIGLSMAAATVGLDSEARDLLGQS
jgi:hypothetical protein